MTEQDILYYKKGEELWGKYISIVGYCFIVDSLVEQASKIMGIEYNELYRALEFYIQNNP